MQAEITVLIKSETPFRHTEKAKMLQQFANLPADDQDRLTQLITNPKALKMLKDKWLMLKAFV